MGRLARTVHGVTVAAVLLGVGPAEGLEYRDAWSPYNAERPVRERTSFIILHTTEAPTESALNKLRDRGEAHFLVDPLGQVYRLLDPRKVALHCGRSLWNGLSDLDQYSIGVEVVGYYNRDITPAQYRAVRELLLILQRTYRIPDIRVLSHGMVAYGTPNRWHPRSHRGRKRCGMVFALPSVREKLGLTSRPSSDPDVDAGRLVVGDPYLARVLYGCSTRWEAETLVRAKDENVITTGRSAWDIARDQYASRTTLYVLPDGRRLRGDEIRDWRRVPLGTRVLLGEAPGEENEEPFRVAGAVGTPAEDLAGAEARSANTLYVFPNGTIQSGSQLTDAEAERLPSGTRVFIGYTIAGQVTAKRMAYDICGIRWRLPSTVYVLPNGRVVTGDRVNEGTIPRNAVILLRR